MRCRPARHHIAVQIEIQRAGIGKEADFRRAVFDPGADIRIAALIDLHINTGEIQLELRHQLRQPGHAGRVEHPQAQHAFVHAVDLAMD